MTTEAVETPRGNRRKGGENGAAPPPTPPRRARTVRRLRFKTVRQVLREAARTYWGARDGEIEPSVAHALVRCLDISLKALQTSTLEQRMADVEKALALAHATAKDGQEPS